jgi:hypothetical protein
MSDERDKLLDAQKGLELMMRDTLEGMEELATMYGYRPWPGQFEIISIQEQEAVDEDTVVWLKTGTLH